MLAEAQSHLVIVKYGRVANDEPNGNGAESTPSR